MLLPQKSGKLVRVHLGGKGGGKKHYAAYSAALPISLSKMIVSIFDNTSSVKDGICTFTTSRSLCSLLTQDSLSALDVHWPCSLLTAINSLVLNHH